MNASFACRARGLLFVFMACCLSAAAHFEAGDVDSSGAVDAADLQLTINAALGVDAGANTDVDFNGANNAIDVQVVVNAVLGLDVDIDNDGVCDVGEPNVKVDNTDSPIGSNLTRFTDWSTEWAFVDCFKQSRYWTSGTTQIWDDGRPLDLDANGWVRSLLPGQTAKTLMFSLGSAGDRYPAGQYVVLYRGEGTIAYDGAASRNVALSRAGREIIDVDPAKGAIQFNIKATNPNNYIRDIHVIMPGGVSVDDPFVWTDDNKPPDPKKWSMFIDNYETQLFHPAFLNSIRKYKVLRFMNWQITNEPDGRGITTRAWGDRPLITDAQWTARGVPVEIMCELANRMHVNPWFCMHHLASDAYVAGFATKVRDALAPYLRAYVEHSNEVWNGQYAQAVYAREAGVAQALSADPFQAQLFYHSLRSVRIFTIWENVFGGTERFVRVMGSQAANAWVSEQALSYKNAYLRCDALGVAPYFDIVEPLKGDQITLEASTVDDLLYHIETESLPLSAKWAKEQKAMAGRFGVELVAYEGGQHLVWQRGYVENDPINTLFDAVNRDPRMGELYTKYLDNWFSQGGGVFVNFLNCMAWSDYGRWGNLEYLTQPRETAPKYNAVHNFIELWQLEATAK